MAAFCKACGAVLPHELGPDYFVRCANCLEPFDVPRDRGAGQTDLPIVVEVDKTHAPRERRSNRRYGRHGWRTR